MISKHTSGFTLVELLVVVSIIALLAAFILPGLSRAREYAYFTRCKNNQRQIAIGFLIYASDNRGRMPEGERGCWEFGDYPGRPLRPRRIGTICGDWMQIDLVQGGSLLRKVYMDPPGSGANWNGDSRGKYIGYPRDRGRYVPVEILWDPTVKVKDWRPWGGGSLPLQVDPLESGVLRPAHSGDETHRDTLTRYYGILGYEFFTHSIGCSGYQRSSGNSEHMLIAYGGTASGANVAEIPFRFSTNHRSMLSSGSPSAWVSACHVPSEAYGGQPRDYSSHFGARQSIEGLFRFNVLHVDGHVHDGIWKDPRIEHSWLLNYTGGWYSGLPYGWLWKAPYDNGLRDTPEFDGAFDRNR